MYYAGMNKGKIFRGNAQPLNHYRGYTKCEGWHLSELSDSNLLVPDTYNDDCSITINGKSNQNTSTQSKNLLDISKMQPYTKCNFTFAGNKSTFTVNQDTGYIFGNVYTTYLTAGVTYNFSCKSQYQNTPPAGISSYIILYDPNTTRVTELSIVRNTTLNSIKYTFTATVSGVYEIQLYPYNQNGTGITVPSGWAIDFYDIQLEVGNITTPVWVAFTPNSPSPDYPSPISSTSNFNIINCDGNNLWEINRGFSLSNCTRIETLPNGITVDGALGSGSARYSSGWLSLKNSVCINRQIVSFNYEILGQKDLGGAENNSIGLVYGAKVGNLTVGDTGRYVGYTTSHPANSYEPYTIFLNSQTVRITNICIGNSTYYPFVGNYTNFPYTLRSLPNGVCDQIVIDNVAKTAKMIQRVGEITLTGNEDCHLLGSNGIQAGFNIYFNKNPYSPSLVVDHSISTHFASTNWATCYDSNGLYIGITITSIFTEADLKTWLTAQYSGANPVKIQYQLYESIETILSYETVLTYYPSTQIYTDATIQPTLDGTFRVMEA